MGTWPKFLGNLVSHLSEENYERTLSDYRFWMKIGTTHGWIPDNQLQNDISENMQPHVVFSPPSPQLIHPTTHLLLKFITDVELNPVSSTHARLCHSSLKDFFTTLLDFDSRTKFECPELGRFYTNVNFLAHYVNLGYLNVEDVRDHILQSLTFRPDPDFYHWCSLLILLKIAGATFAAYVNPSVMDRCIHVLKSKNYQSLAVATLAKDVITLSESNWEGLPPPPTLIAVKPENVISMSQDPATTPVATSLGLPDVIRELSETPTIPSPTPGHPSDESARSSAPPSPSTSISTLSDFAALDSLDGDPIVEPGTITPHYMFYLDDRSVEVICGMTLFRVHTSILSFHSPVLRQMFSSANLAAAESPNGCPRIESSDTPADFAVLLKAIYLPGFPEKGEVPDFSTFSSLLKVSTKYEMSNLRAQMLETIRDAYPENFEGLDPSKTFGENAFGGSKPHPNAVLNLFVEQNVTSALPMAYYMAARRGLDSLMDSRPRLQSGATLSGQTLKSAMRGLVALQVMEHKEMHQIVFTFDDTANRPGCFSKDCPSRGPKGLSGAGIMQAQRRVFDRIMGSAAGGTRILQVLSANEFAGDGESKFCQTCAERMKVAHADLRRKAWVTLCKRSATPEVAAPGP